MLQRSIYPVGFLLKKKRRGLKVTGFIINVKLPLMLILECNGVIQCDIKNCQQNYKGCKHHGGNDEGRPSLFEGGCQKR